MLLQLILDISSKKEADLIRELMKRFKNVQVSGFDTDLPITEVKVRINEGLQDIENEIVTPWEEVKSTLLNRIN